MTDNQPYHDLIQSMPKAELHVHLEGTVQPETMLELARRHNMTGRLPGDSVEELRSWFNFTGFPHFAQVYLTIQELLRTADDFAHLAYMCGADMAAQNIVYREVTFTPHTHIDLQDKELTIWDILEGLERGRRQALEEFGVEMRWVFDIYRNLCFPDGTVDNFDPEPADRTVTYALTGLSCNVIGVGLGGNEVDAPPEPFRNAFARAKIGGLLSLPHAGETEGPQSVLGALYELAADRIGHGVRAIENPDLVRRLADEQIALEVCLTSNLRLGIYPDLEHHPLTELLSAGVLVTINSDDPPLFNTTLVKEYELLPQMGFDRQQIAGLARNGFLAMGAAPDLKARLLADFDTWAQENLP